MKTNLPIQFNAEFSRKCHVSFINATNGINVDVNPNISSLIISLMWHKLLVIVCVVDCEDSAVLFIKAVKTIRDAITA